MKNFDVLIIGGGISGCAIARELSRWQLKIALIEKNNDICEGTTKANSAIVHPGHNVTSNTLMAKYNVAGSHIFESICKELTVPFQQNGGYNVAFSTDDLPKLQALYKQGIKNGIQNMQILSAEELHKREPNLTTNVKQALYTPSSAITCPYELTIGYAENAAQNGVQFLLEQKVKLVQKTMDGWQILTDDNQIMKTKIVVNAAGLYADILNNQVSKHHFQILPKKGEYELFDKKFDGAFHSTIFQMPGPMGKGILISPTVDGTIILGPTATEQQSRDDKSTTAEELEKLRKLGQILWPKMPRAGVITSFAGLRAHTTVGDFILGEPDDAPNFYNIAGIESPGLTSAPAIAQDYAKRIAERLQAPPNSTFTPIRKKAKPFRLMTPQERQAAIAENPQYGNMICRCEQVTEAEIYAAIHTPPGARTIDGIKRRTRAGMGRCQSGFCLPKILKILADQQKLDAEKITKDGFHSNILIQNQNYNGPISHSPTFSTTNTLQTPEIIIVGAGPAGLAAAIGAYDAGNHNILILERDTSPGGILQQCIHTGFGLHLLGKELSGPEYAQHYLDEVLKRDITIQCNTMVLDIDSQHNVTCISPQHGYQTFTPKSILLAMGCRERPRGSIGLPGTRCAGIYSAGTAQRFINLEGKMPGKRVVILGSGDIGLIMARRLHFSGSEVLAVAEIMPYSSGLRRNIAQCLDDFNIPLLLNHTVTQIHGNERLTGVTISAVDSQRQPIPGSEKFYECDTLLLSVGLIPENELSEKAGIVLSPATSGPIVNENLESNIPGIFVCGNVLHVHDLVDHVTEESFKAGAAAAQFTKENHNQKTDFITISDGKNIRGIVPQKVSRQALITGQNFSFRPLNVFHNAAITAQTDNQILKTQKRRILTPGEMADFTLKLTPDETNSIKDGVTLNILSESKK